MEILEVEEGGITYQVQCISTGSKFWILDSNYHRILGPAIIFVSHPSQWWYQGKRVRVNNQTEYEQWLKLRVFE